MISKLSPAHWLVVVVPLVIIGFFLAHFLIASSAEEVLEDARAAETAAHETVLLGRIRADLHAMGIAVGSATFGIERFDREEFERRRRDVDVQLARLRASMDPKRVAEVERALADADAALVEAADRIEAGGREAGGGRFLPPLDHAERLLDASTIAPLRDIEAASTAIANTQRQIARRAPVLHAGAASFGLLLMGLASVAARQQLRLDEQRNALLGERARELELFAARVAHDLKNPLHALVLRTELVRRKLDGDDSMQRQLDGIGAIVARMNDMIDALLTFARAGGRIEADARADVRSVVNAVLEDFRADAVAAGAEISVESSGDALVRVAPAVLGVVLGNLLRNALKFIVDAPTPERRIDVHVEERGSVVALRVDDTGPGVPEGMETAIFQPFARARANSPGLGLGLATVRRLVEGYGGEVVAKRRQPNGASFVVELPRASS